MKEMKIGAIAQIVLAALIGVTCLVGCSPQVKVSESPTMRSAAFNLTFEGNEYLVYWHYYGNGIEDDFFTPTLVIESEKFVSLSHELSDTPGKARFSHYGSAEIEAEYNSIFIFDSGRWEKIGEVDVETFSLLIDEASMDSDSIFKLIQETLEHEVLAKLKARSLGRAQQIDDGNSVKPPRDERTP